jgi:hypothetical protein
MFPHLSISRTMCCAIKRCLDQSLLDRAINSMNRTPGIVINRSEPLQPTITGEIETPVAVASVEFIDPREPVLVSLFLNTRYCTCHL